MASVKINDVRKFFGALEVLHGVSIDIDDGEFVVLVGPSGCGKSTLLRMIAGLETISEGDVSIDDTVVNDMEPKARDIAMVFQNYALYPHMTVAENMGFSLRLRGVPLAERQLLVKRSAEILSLTDYLDRLPKQLSGGQRQRVAMGRAIVREPKVFLFDEPLSNLDAKLRVQMRTEIRELHHRLKTTMIYVTHDQVEAMTMADKIVVMRDGYVEQIGGPLELYDRPANRFVAGFIGSPAMNLVEGKLNGAAGREFVAKEGWTMPISGSEVPCFDGPSVLGLRPEHLEVVSADTQGALPVEIVVVEPMGSETILFTRAGQTSIIAASRQRHSFKAGDRIGLRPMENAAHFFDTSPQGQRLN
ncbi:ABC transporter ATP-binding protein [Rhizobium binxianense]